MTYFFHEGKIYVILNKLTKLNSDEYDAEGTGYMVINTLKETLGVSETRLAMMLVHFTYDGVYATSEERIHGGGCLNLIKNVAALLGLNEGAITGQ
mgnify:FL=1